MTSFDTPPAAPAPATPRRHRRWPWPLGIAGAIALGLAATGVLTVAGSTAASGPAAHRSGSATVAAAGDPSWTFTRLDGSTGSLAGLRGQKTVLWLVAAGCSSCGVSVPAVAQHLNTLTAEGWHVVALDLSGDLPAGTEGLKGLRSFVQATGGNPDDPRWSWGLASQPLSMAYDPTGSPDQYYLLDEQGRRRYQGSVPVSTMPQLLAHAKQLPAGGS